MNGLSENTVNLIHQNTVKYLHKITENVPSNLSILKSYYALKFRVFENQSGLHLPQSKNKLEARCPRCCLKLSETDASYTVKPEPKKSKFFKKLIHKAKTKKPLTRYQARYLKKNKTPREHENRLVITCNFCKRKVFRKLRKPVKLKCRIDNNANKTTPNKKKKSKKDPFCGLKKTAVVAANKITPNKKKKSKDPFCVSQKTAVVAANNMTPNNKNKSKKDPFCGLQEATAVTVKSPKKGKGKDEKKTEAKTTNNAFSRRKEIKQKKKNVRQLSKMLSACSLKKPQNNLTHFLQSFNK